MQTDAQEKPISVRWESEDRYYLAHLQQDLFGEWVLSTAWGGKRTGLGNSKSQPVPSYGAGLEALDRLGKTRIKHGYREITGDD